MSTNEGNVMNANPSRSHLSSAMCALCFCVGASSIRSLAQAQALQSGDIVVAANQYPSAGRIYRVRGQNLAVLAACNTYPRDLIIDQEGRVVFLAASCGGNSNSSGLYRLDPDTGSIEFLACFPWDATPQNIPAGLPQNALGFSLPNGLHASRSLEVTLDNNVFGDVPQVNVVECYGLSLAVKQSNGTYVKEAFRYRVDTDMFEKGVSLAQLPPGGNTGAAMAVGAGGTFYSGGSEIGRAAPDLNLSVHFGTASASITLLGKNEIVVPTDVLDNTAIPNTTVQCGMLTDDDVPFEGGGFHFLDGMHSIGVLGGLPVAITSSLVAGRPYLFGLSKRGTFLSPFTCADATAVQANAPHAFFAVPVMAKICVDGSRLVGGDDSANLIEVTQSGYQVLATSAGGELFRPQGAAVYPPPTPPITSAALVIRIHSGSSGSSAQAVNVLLVDTTGRRLGQLADGTMVNDFGDEGTTLDLGSQGRLIAMIDPPPSSYSLQAVGQVDGPYVVDGYIAETSTGGGHAVLNCNAQTGLIQEIEVSPTSPTSLTLTPICSNQIVYCTAGATTNGCFATISSAGSPSASATSGFTITVSNVEGQKAGLLFYGTSGALATPWGTATSFLCVKSPTQRLPADDSGGTAGLCDGVLARDWLAFIAANPLALSAPFEFGEVVNAQAWFRDPGSPKTTSLSNALQFTLCP